MPEYSITVRLPSGRLSGVERVDLLCQAAGGVIVLLALLDVFFTILFPASGHGPIRKPLAAVVWRGFWLIGAATKGQRRRNLLSYSGPVMFAVTSAAWFAFLVIGWAMIYKPALGSAITAASGPTHAGWTTAIYYSGFNLTTLGVGNVAANTGAYRLLTITEAAFGAAFFGMAITYFLSVYSELTSRNAFAQGLHYLTGQTGNAAELLARLADGPDLTPAREHLASKAEFLRQIYQTHRFYPVLRHFYYREPYYALPRILLIALDTVTLLHSALDREHYARLLRSPVLDDLYQSAMSVARELSDSGRSEEAPQAEDAWRRHYQAAVARLAQAELVVRQDREAGTRDYIARRARWEPSVRRVATLVLYEWETIEPPRT